MSGYSNAAWYSVLAIFGAVMGFIASIIFLLIYYGMEYTEYVPDSVRMKTSAIATAMIFAATLIIYFRNEIFRFLKSMEKDS